MNHPDERFTVVAARGEDDIWVEMRRQPTLSADAAAVIAELRHDDTVPVDVEPPEPAAVEAASPPPVAPIVEVEEMHAQIEEPREVDHPELASRWWSSLCSRRSRSRKPA